MAAESAPCCAVQYFITYVGCHDQDRDIWLHRISMDVLGHGPEWWGITVLVIGAVSSVIGVLYALMEHDIKKLLAYHSIENIGIILLGVGSSMMFAAMVSMSCRQ